MSPPSSRPHVFVCYAREDAAAIDADIEWLRREGFDVWFDRHIEPGAEWAQVLADAIDHSYALLFVASHRSIDSPHCRNEIAYAVDNRKPVLTVFNEPVDLRGGLKLSISRAHALVRWQLNDDEYYRQLRNALESHLRDATAGASATSPPRRVWRVPLNRNLSFTGREEVLEEVRRRFAAARQPLTLALNGPAGVGKSQLALEYLYRHATSVKTVAWIRAEKPSTLDADFVHLALELGLAREGGVDTPLVLDLVRRWLAGNRDWLLVLDNVESPDILGRYLPDEPSGNVLITSRRQSWGRLAKPLLLEPFDRSEAVSFLLSRTSSNDARAAEMLATALGHLPLALEEAAAYVEATGKTLEGYLRLFEAHHDALLAVSQPPEDYPSTLRTTLEVSLQQLEAEDARAADLLRMIAFLAPDDIPESLLTTIGSGIDSSLPAEIAVDQCLASLRRYSLVKTDGDAVSVHRLTQLVTRSLMDDPARKDKAARMLTLMSNQFPRVSDMGETGMECRRLLPHALAALSYARALPDAAVPIGKLLGRTGTYLSARNLSTDAVAHLARAYEIFRADQQHRALFARTCELYGRVLFANGSLDDSRRIFREALPMFEAEGPSGLLHRMQIHIDLAWVLWTDGRLAEALEDAERSLRLLESTLGDSDPHRAISMSMMARLQLDLGDVHRARETVESVIADIPSIPMPDRERQPLLCAVFLQTAQVLRCLGAPLRARTWALESLQLGRSVYSEHHALMGATRCVLGQALMDLEEFEAARLELAAVAECAERSTGRLNQHVVVALCHLAITLVELGELDQAERLIVDRMTDVAGRIAGDSAFAASYADVSRGRLAAARNDHRGAIRYLESADRRMAERYGEGHIHRLYPLALLAESLRACNRLDDAMQAHQLALDISQRAGLGAHPQRGRHLLGLAEIARQQGHSGDASGIEKEARQMLYDCLGP